MKENLTIKRFISVPTATRLCGDNRRSSGMERAPIMPSRDEGRLKANWRATVMLLAALLTMTAQTAWAQEQSETIATTAKIVEGTHFTISSNDNYADGDGMCADFGITVTPKNGETITKVVISCTYYPEEVNDGNTSVSSGTKEITNGGGLKMSIKGVIFFIIKYLAPLAIAVIFITGFL